MCTVKREGIIRELAEGKSVLDVGSVGQSGEYSLWNELKEVAGSLTGIDVTDSPDEDVVKGDMESYDFSREFDVIVLGDVLEHVKNQGLLLDNVRRHLSDEGVLVVTTPNAKWWTVFLKPNPTHTLWHDSYTLTRILEDRGFAVERLLYYPGNKKTYPLPLIPFIWRQGLLAICRKRL